MRACNLRTVINQVFFSSTPGKQTLLVHIHSQHGGGWNECVCFGNLWYNRFRPCSSCQTATYITKI